MEFPCDFSIKIIGTNTELFLSEIKDILSKHFSNIADVDIKSNPSNKDKYLAITATVHAKNQKDLDALYMELTKHADVKMVL